MANLTANGGVGKSSPAGRRGHTPRTAVDILNQYIQPRPHVVSERRSELARNRPRDADGRFLSRATKDCATCTETKSVSYFPQARISQTCIHNPNTCLDCLKTSIRVNFETRQWNQIYCPECRALLDHQDVQKFADKDTFRRFGSFPLSLCVHSHSDDADILQIRFHVSPCGCW